MGANGSTGPEAVAAAEKNAAILTAKAGARDPSATPSICRVSAALQYPGGESSFICDNIRSMPKIRGLSVICPVMEELTFSPFGQFLLEGFSLYRKPICRELLVVYLMACHYTWKKSKTKSISKSINWQSPLTD